MMRRDFDLAEALAAAAEHINTRRELPEVLQDLVEMAGSALPDVDHVGVSVAHRDERVETLASTDPLVTRLNELQYELHEGPCLDAIWSEDLVLLGEDSAGDRWPHFLPPARAMGLRSLLAVRLYVEDKSVGGLVLYSTSSPRIDPEVQHVARLFAALVALALGKSMAEEDLRNALVAQKRIGEAIGILMERLRLDEDRAFLYLARVSRQEDVKLREVAEHVVRSVVTAPPSRARGRPLGPPWTT